MFSTLFCDSSDFAVDIFVCCSYSSLLAVAIPEYIYKFLHMSIYFCFSNFFFWILFHALFFLFSPFSFFSIFLFTFLLHSFFFHHVSYIVVLSLLYSLSGTLLKLSFPGWELLISSFNWLISFLVSLVHQVNLLYSFCIMPLFL